MLEEKELFLKLTDASRCSESSLKVAFDAPEISLLKTCPNLKALFIEGIFSDFNIDGRNWNVSGPQTCSFELPEVEELYITGQILSETYIRSILDKQPKLKVLGLTFANIKTPGAFGEMNREVFNKRFSTDMGEKEYDEYLGETYTDYHIYCALNGMDSFFADYPNLESIECGKFKQGNVDYIGLKPRKKDAELIGVFHYYTGSDCRHLFFLEALETIEVFRAPYWFKTYGKTDGILEILENNRNLHTFQFSWNAPFEILNQDVPVFMAEKKHGYHADSVREKNRIKLVEQFTNHPDPQLQKIIRFYLSGHADKIEPSVESTLSLLGAKVKAVRSEALNYFTKKVSGKIDSFAGKKISVLGALNVYKFAAAKDIVEEKGGKLLKKFSDTCDVLVIGQTPRIDTLPEARVIISSTRFEELLDQNEDRPLAGVDNRFEERLMDLLLSEDPQNALLSLKLMEDGGIPKDLIALVFGLFKMHPDSKVRARTKKIIERHGGIVGERAMKICGKRNYIAMKEDDKPRKDYDQLELIEGFDVALFGYYVARTHTNKVGRFLMSSSESKWAKRFVMEVWNVESCTIVTAPSSHFVNAKNIKKLWCGQLSDAIWKMEGLEKLEVISHKDKLIVPESISALVNLESLKIVAKEIELHGILCVQTLHLNAKKISYGKIFDLQGLEKLFAFGEVKDWTSFFVSSLKELRSEGKKFVITKALCDNSPLLKNIHLDVKDLRFEDNVLLSSLESLCINGAKKVQLEAFLGPKIKSIKINDAGKTTLDDTLDGITLELLSIDSKSIIYDCEQASFSVETMYVQSLKNVFKGPLAITIKHLEVSYFYIPELMTDCVESLKISYKGTYQDRSQEYVVPDDLVNYPNLKSVEFCAKGSGGPYSLKFDTKSDFSFQTLTLGHVQIVIGKPPNFRDLKHVIFNQVRDSKFVVSDKSRFGKAIHGATILIR